MGHRSQREQVAQAQGMPSSQRQIELSAASRFYTGPIPEARDLAEYEQINPGLANRIIKMAENEQGHRHVIEDRRNLAEVRLTTRGQVFGFIISLLTISCGAILTYYDKSMVGLVSLVSGVAMLIGGFLFQRGSAARRPKQ
jgi:uncharacterized membrane protein